MKMATIKISISQMLIDKIDEVAEQENISRSHLFQEAARNYLKQTQRWKQIFAFGKEQVRRLGLKPKDVEGAICAYR